MAKLIKTKTVLKNLDEFNKLLDLYEPSLESRVILKEITLVLLVGPSAAGRNTLINLLVQTGRYHFIVSDTTRQPRVNNGVKEQNGREYWFRTEEQFLKGLRQGAYIEAAVIHKQQVSGISISELTAAKDVDKIPVNEIEVSGARNLQKLKPDALFIFLLPPNFEIWMKRLNERGNMTRQELRRRLESAEAEIASALTDNFYHFVINHEIHEATVAVDELANRRAPDNMKQELGRNHAEQLAVDIQIYLRNSPSL
jgi:guanylate kinase